ncbi:M1 family metallopeptidase [Gynurincola endophyticus]|uniref:M1 family metallopeptidase n=1 Tax=Gynurincola endophyticus TaxID=2479004 RepID=UPI000F8DE01B|nr:M1 family metallopeptidase [Gynurincola endophyticus]
MRKIALLAILCAVVAIGYSQPLNQKTTFTMQDTLRGSIGEHRAWWDVEHYNIEFEANEAEKSIRGFNEITFNVLAPGKKMQIDLQEPMEITKAEWNKKSLPFTRNGNVYYIEFPKDLKKGSKEKIKLSYSGNPRIAKRAPWDGGLVFAKDDQGRPWITIACQGLGASVWLPIKDHQSEEPNKGADITIIVPNDLVGVSNGRLISEKKVDANRKAYHWRVVNPINSYNIIPYIGHYVHFGEKYQGEKGVLDLDYWVLDYNLEKAKKQFEQVKPMMKCFEEWMGAYPFYEDSYKLVESSHLGMEHQSAVAYGNKYQNGYLGRDMSGSGFGAKWDYIIIHETGHEWFGNNITSFDIADMWVHEGFTTYTEVIYTECQSGAEGANAYVKGLRRGIGNRTPIIGQYGVNKEGSGDMYSKGANIIHTIRQLFPNTEEFKKFLRGIYTEYYHKNATTQNIENAFSKAVNFDLSKVFDHYLRSTGIPELEYYVENGKFSYRWTKVNEGFNLPVQFRGKWVKDLPGSTTWQSVDFPADVNIDDVTINDLMYVTGKKVK